MVNFLLELMVEEIPSGMQSAAISEFEKLLAIELEKFRIGYANIRSYVSPRRMVFSADLNPIVEEFWEEKKGPQTTAPSETVEKFLQANGASRHNCFEKQVDGKTFIFISLKREAKNTSELLAEVIINALKKIPFKKSMRWRNYQFSFIRPLRNIMAILDGRSLNAKFSEINLEFQDHAWGRRFLSPNKIKAQNIDEYLKKTRDSLVIVDQLERKQIILDEFKKLESQNHFSVEIDEKLLEEVVGLTEYPVVLLGKIPEKFMKLPEEVIVTPMQVHQRYFPVKINGTLAPYFAFVANNVATDGGKTIISGNERVLNARLADALFFFETDLQRPLKSRLEELKKISFNDRLGTVFDRVVRVVNLCGHLGDSLKIQDIEPLRKAALLAKCDLSTGMVGEFSELQGIMGAYYARIQGENSDVCDAIRDQYRPADEITKNLSGLLSLADKIELITGFFAIGKEPTGSKDPFALRRAAIGIIKIVKNFNLLFDLKEIIQKAFEQLPGTDLKPDAVEKVHDFILDRLKIVLKELGISPEAANSVATSDNPIPTIYRRAEILNDFLNRDSGKKLLEMHKRIKNIVQSNDDDFVNETLLKEKEEINLLEKIQELEKNLLNIRGFEDQLAVCLTVEKQLIDFFDKILVNTRDERVRQNRRNLLTKLSFVFNSVMKDCATQKKIAPISEKLL
ncbi:MAG: glycine--tRNA ligase subunit beta [Holosporaceae bacterium]|jgi:glycyl-tRNA synthetase beta chain|nr:glycine--tRNA ligase subunit beta [Holosporaceae bacterium]